MTDRDHFLGTVRAALGRDGEDAGGVEPDPATHLALSADEVQAEAARVLDDARARSGELLDELAQSAAEAGWRVHRRSSPEDAAEVVLDVCRAANVARALFTTHDVLERVPVIAALEAAGIEMARAETGGAMSAEALRAAEFSFDAGITGADWAVAETGTVVLHPRRGAPRLASVAQPLHVALVERGQVLPSLDELFLLERQAFITKEHGGSLNLISGPSKTGDIGATIVEGIHGPLEVHLVLVG